jgi:hypothetical protein
MDAEMSSNLPFNDSGSLLGLHDSIHAKDSGLNAKNQDKIRGVAVNLGPGARNATAVDQAAMAELGHQQAGSVTVAPMVKDQFTNEDDIDMGSLDSLDFLLFDIWFNHPEDALEAEANGKVTAAKGSTHNQDFQLDINANETAANALAWTFARNDDNVVAQEEFAAKPDSSPQDTVMAQPGLLDAEEPSTIFGMEFYPILGAAVLEDKTIARPGATAMITIASGGAQNTVEIDSHNTANQDNTNSYLRGLDQTVRARLENQQGGRCCRRPLCRGAF